MDSDLIRNFRDKANEQWFCYTHYSDVNGKNLWNCICSAMDWITVGVSNINFRPRLHIFGHSEETTLNILILLMQVAMIKEGIEQLHRVFMKTSEIYLNDDKMVWGQNLFSQTDNEYFETLRACFGAHPVNLKGFKSNDTEKHRFASWPYVGIDGFEVALYPSSSEGKDILLNISFDQLELFAGKRYDHLKDLIEIIDTEIRKRQAD